MTRYNDDMINILVRDALSFEKKRKFQDAIDIYEELALQGIDFAIDRIPLVKHRLDNYKLRRVELFTSIVSACVVGVTIVTLSYNIAMNLMTQNNLNTSFALEQIKSQQGSPQTLKVNYHSIDNTQPINKSSEFDIFVKSNISRKDLTNRVLEAISLYEGQIDPNTSTLTIDIKTKTNNSTETVGYIHFNAKKTETCNVYTFKGKL